MRLLLLSVAVVVVLSVLGWVTSLYFVQIHATKTRDIAKPHRWIQCNNQTQHCNYYCERVAKSCRIDLRTDLVVGVITYKGRHDTTISLAKQTWISPQLLNKSVFIFSETKDNSIPTIVTENCDSLRLSPMGIPCKVLFMFRWMYNNLPPHKWYYRALDDSMLNLPELVRYLRKYDHTQPMLIGMRQAINLNDKARWNRYEELAVPENEQRQYPQGGPGWVISRGYLEKLMTGNYTTVLENMAHDPAWQHADDLIWGVFTTNTLGIPITMSRGISKYPPEVHECGFEWKHMNIEELPQSSQVPLCPVNEKKRWDNVDHEPITAFHMGFEKTPKNWQVMDAVMKLFITNMYTTRMVMKLPHSDSWYYVVCPCKYTASPQCTSCFLEFTSE